MEIVPVLPIRDGAPMVGRPGAWEPMATPYPDGGNDLRGLARHLFARFQRVVIVDLGTGRTGEPDHNLYQKLAKQQVALWVDARPESLEDVMDIFVAGADRVTVRMDRVDLDDLEEVLEMADGEVWLGYAYKDLGGLREMLRDIDPYRFIEAGAEGIVLIDLTRAGTTQGPDVAAVQAVPYKDVPVYVSGGISRPEDVARLQDAGAAGAFVGQALLADLDTWARVAREYRSDADGKDAADKDDGDGDGAGAGRDADKGAPGSAGFTIESPTSPLPGVLPGSGPHSRRDR